MDAPEVSDRELPSGYPQEFVRRLTMRDGREVVIRPILPTDATELAEAIRTADAETLHRRFMTGAPTITPALLQRLTTIDYVRRFALVALAGDSGRGIAVARYEPLPEDGVAEIAVAVDPAWRRIGVASTLLETLAEAALHRGVHAFSVYYLADNRDVATLMHEAGARHQLIEQGVAEGRIPLDEAALAAAREHHRPPAGEAPVAGPEGARDLTE